MAVMTANGLLAHQLDVETYEQIIGSGALDGQRVELIDGIITEMSPQSEEHSGIIERLMGYLAPFAGRGLRVQVPMGVSTPDSLPEPDLLVADAPSNLRTRPRSARLVIEVAVSSQALDRGRKRELYAASGFLVYWLVDVPARSVEVRTEPANGEYRALTVYRVGEMVPAPLPELEPLDLAGLFAGLD